jgi:hypothetical protein
MGFGVLPIHPKYPNLRPMTNAIQLASRLRQSPPDTAIALVLPTRIFAIKAVGDRGGLESLREMEAVHGPLPTTLTAVSTASRDRHLFFRLPAGATLNRSLGDKYPGLEVEASGDRIVVEPSPGQEATAWEDWEPGEPWTIADAPEWLPALAPGESAPAPAAPEQPDPVPAPSVTNEEFLRAVMGELAPGESGWVCAFTEAPSVNARWGGQPYRPGDALTFFNPSICNMYFSVGVLKGPKRQKQHMARMAVLVADEVDLATLKALPSYVLETSPGNHQAGFIISSGGDDLARCDQVTKELGRLGYLGTVDKSGNNPVRYVRMPIGVNTKPRESGHFAHRLLEWRPELRYSLNEAAGALGIDLSARAPASANLTPAQPSGQDAATAAARIAAWRADISDPNLDKRSYHSALTSWAASKLQTGMAPGAVVNELRAEMLVCKPTEDQCAAQGKSFVEELRRWQERHDKDIPHAVETAQQKFQDRKWGAPVDLWSKIVAPGAKREFFPAVIADYAFEVAEVSGFDPGFVGMAALLAAAGAIDDRIQIQCKLNDPTFLQAPRLWLMLVGSPSTKKSPVVKTTFARLVRLEEELRRKYADAMKEYDHAYRVWRSACKRAEKDRTELPREPARPDLTRLVVDDTTTERLQTVLAANPRGVIQVRDELSGWFGSMGAYCAADSASKDQAHWLQLYEGGSRMFDRQWRGDLFVPNWSASVVGTIQPDTIKKIVSRLPNDGLMQRFIPVIGQRHEAVDRKMNTDLVDAFGDLLERLYRVRAQHGKLLQVSPVEMCLEADATRKRVFDRLGDLIRTFESGNPRLASHVGKWEGLYCRLVLVVHCIECANLDVHPTELEVSVESALLVERLMFKHMMPHLLCFYQEVLEDGGASSPSAGNLLDDVRKLGEHILTKGWKVFTDRIVTHAVKFWRFREIKQKVERYAALEAMGWIAAASEPDKRGMAPSYLVNPAVHTMFVEKAASFAESMQVMANLLSGSRASG